MTNINLPTEKQKTTTFIDLTDSRQKTLAGIMLAGIVGVIWLLLPPFIWFMEHLIYAGALAFVVVGTVYNRQLIWDMFKDYSWNLTKNYKYNQNIQKRRTIIVRLFYT